MKHQRYLTILVLYAAFIPQFFHGTAVAHEKLHFEVFYTAKVNNIPESAGKVKVWIPYPKSDEYQKIYSITTSAPYPTYIHEDKEYGNSFLYMDIDNPGEREINIRMEILAVRYEAVHKLKPGDIGSFDEETLSSLNKYFINDVDDEAREMARDIARKYVDPVDGYIEKVKAIYDYVYDNMDYSKDIEGYGEGDIVRACTVKSGNCIDFHSLFIVIAREAGIVAREVGNIDLPFEEGVPNYCEANYHCNVEVYLPNYGWFPLDVSHAKKGKRSKEFYFGSLDNLRLKLGHGRNISLAPRQEGNKLARMPLQPYVEIDGIKHEDVEVSVFASTHDISHIKDNRRTQLIAAGERAEIFNWMDIDGNNFNLGDFIGRKPVLINFFTTWCGRCNWETDGLIRAYSDYEDIEIVRINLMEKPEKVREFVDRYQIPFKVLPDEKGEIASLFGVKYVPSNIIIDKSGNVQYSGGFFTEEELRRRLDDVRKNGTKL